MMNHSTIAPRPAFAANIAFVTPETFEKIMEAYSAKNICHSPWVITDPQQVEKHPAAFTEGVTNCTAAVISNERTAQLPHLDPRNEINQLAINTSSDSLSKEINLEEFIKKSKKPDTKSVVVIGGRANYGGDDDATSLNLQNAFLQTLNKAKLYPSYFLEQFKKVKIGYIGKDTLPNLNPLIKDTVFIQDYGKKWMGEDRPDFPKNKDDLLSFISGYFGKWHVSKNDKLVWVNEHLDIHDPKFIEEIPRHLYNTHA